MRVTKWGEYGILCCLHLARQQLGELSAGSASLIPNNAPIGALEISKAHGIPLQYAQQILHRLRKGGIIKSVRGPRGGFKLVRSPATTNLKDVLYAAEGHTFHLICDDNPIHDNCSQAAKDCGLRWVWNDLKTAVDGLLESRSLLDLIERERVSGKPGIFGKNLETLLDAEPLVAGPRQR